MRLQTRKDCEAEARARRLLRQDLIQANADNATKAIELVTLKQHLDRWKVRALAGERALADTVAKMRDAHRALSEENKKLRAELAAAKEEKSD